MAFGNGSGRLMVAGSWWGSLFFEDKKNSQDQAGKACQVVPLESFGFEKQEGKDGEDGQRDDFLNDFKLHQGKRPAVQFIADAVGRHHQAVFKESNSPTDEDDGKQPQVLRELHFLELQVAVPSKSHEGIGQDEQQNRLESFHWN